MSDSHGHAAHSAGGHHAMADRPRYDDINVPVVVMVGIVSAILTYWIVVLVQGVTYQMTSNYVRQRSYDVPYVKSVDALERQKTNLTANVPGRVSIDEAMQETLKQFSKSSAPAN